MPQMPKLGLYAAIRRDHPADMTVRELVRKALNSARPEPRKPLPSEPDPYKTGIDSILRVDLDAPRKQRHTLTLDTASPSAPTSPSVAGRRPSPSPVSARPSSTA